MEFAKNLILNVSLLLAVSIIYNMFFLKKIERKKPQDVLIGILVGFVGIFLMMNTVNLSPGIIFDTRSILVSVTGMFFGTVPTVTAVLIIISFRIITGGSGVLAGIMVTVFTAGIGLAWHHLRLKHILLKKKKIWLEFYLFGVATHIAMLACMLALPHDIVFAVLKDISLPVLIIYPVGTLLICLSTIKGLANRQTELDLKESDLRLRTMFEQAPIGIAVANEKGVIFSNAMFEKLINRSKEQILSCDWKKFTHPDDLEMEMEKFNKLMAGKISEYSIEKRYIRPDGSIVWANLTIASLNMDNQPENNYLCMAQDITEMISAKEKLKESETNYKNLYHEFQKKQVLLLALLNSIPDLIFYKDIEGIYMGCNKAFEKFADIGEDQIVGHNDFELFNKKIPEQFRKIDNEIINQKIQIRNEELVTYPDGSKVCLDTLKTPYYDQEDKVMGIIGISRDISERKQKEDEILYLSYHDVLTGLYNRTFFDDAQKRLDDGYNLPLSVIIGDIDGLKLINDAFGHGEGDQLLVEISKILGKCCRQEDIIARTGGDEFSILLPKTNSDVAKVVYDKIKKTCEEYETKSDKRVYYTSISLGYATKMKDDESFEKLYKIAEEHMYRRKLLVHKSLHSSIISSIKTAMLEKSNETQEHEERLADLSNKLGKQLGLNEEELIALELVSTLHDIGKISIDSKILSKTGKLSAEDWVELRKHPEVGYRIAQTVPELRQISEYILCHHERWDGKGYPQGLIGESIPLLSRIIAVVDSYDAMTQDRAYRKAKTKEAAIVEIEDNSGTQFDPKIAALFIKRLLSNVCEQDGKI